MKKNKITIILSIVCILIVSVFTLIRIPKDKVFTKTITKKDFSDPVEVNYINKIEINLDTTKAKISPAYTYRELMTLFEDNWGFPEESSCDYGNNNVYFYTCPSSAKCNFEDTTRYQYGDQVPANRYHWVNFEIYTKDCPEGAGFCENDFDPEHLENIEVWLNGEKIEDAIIADYNDYWHEVDIYVPIASYNGPLVRKITVTSAADYIEKGTNSTFTADIEAYGDGTDSVNWSIIDKNSNDTTISPAGVLTVAADETANMITIRATSTYDNTVYGEKRIYIIDEPLSITSVSIKEKNKTVVYGGSYQFSATVVGTDSHAITWNVSGANKSGTTIAADGTLTVAADETAESITVTATSVADNTKNDSVTVNIRNTEMINKIEISYDPSEVAFSNRTTYNSVRNKLARIWELPDNAGYDKGNNNIWIRYCETTERCTSYITNGYSENMKTDRYTYVVFEIFAKPSGDSYMSNPEYDFDEDHLEEIEIWVNGVKRDDAFASDYNDAWREVDIFVPITVTNDKLNQEFEFNYDTYNTTYGHEPIVNSISSYNQVLEGELTYESSDETIATVDNEGYVTIKKVGTCTITATAAETDDYKEYSNSYTLVVAPKYINPTITGYENSYYYTGSKITPNITVSYNEIPLVKDTDYTISYGENTNTGYGYIYLNPVEGSNYTFDEDYSNSFYINRKTITEENITINPSEIPYNGSAREVDITVIVDGRTLVKDTDYTVSYSNNTNIGTAYIYITGINNYNGTPYKTFEITEAPEYEMGDLNKNGKIDLNDIIVLLKKYLGTETTTPEDIEIGDMNENDKIDLNDIILLLKTYLGVN